MGPLAGIKVIEFAGIGPCPMAAMMLAEMGATVLRIDRMADSGLGIPLDTKFEVLKRSRHIIRLDLKRPEAIALTLRLIEQSDALIEGFRPKVMERLGLGPDACLARNPRLVFGRVTGWGQEGPLAHAAGHDLNYIALTGALHAIGRAGGPPTPPLNLVGDFGGGALYLVVGVLAAIIEARRSGKGQVVDAAMVDGASSLMTSIYGGKASGRLSGPRGTNITRTRARISTRSMNVPMAASCRSRRSRRSSTRNCCGCWRSIRRQCRRRWIARVGRRRRRDWRNVFPRGRAMSGVRCWKAATLASRRCCRWMRRRRIRITWRGACSPSWMACRSRCRRRGSAARRSMRRVRRSRQVRWICVTRWPRGDWTGTRWKQRKGQGYWPEDIPDRADNDSSGPRTHCHPPECGDPEPALAKARG